MAANFTTRRERALWIAALIVVLLILSSLPFAAELAEELDERSLFDAVFAAGFVLIVVAVATQAIRSKPGWLEAAVTVGVLGVALMGFARLAAPAERTHLFEYALVAVLIHQALLERQRGGGSVPTPWLTAITVTAGIGLADEAVQAVIPDRVFDWRDVAFNAGAAIGGGRRRIAGRVGERLPLTSKRVIESSSSGPSLDRRLRSSPTTA